MIPIKTTFLAIILLIPLFIHSQEQNNNFALNSSLYYGPNIGVNITNILTDTHDYTTAWVPSVGFGVTYLYKDRFGISSNVMYSVRGGNSQSPFEKIRVNYFDLNLSAIYKPISVLGFECGYNFGLISSAKKIIPNSSTASGSSRIDIEGYRDHHQLFGGVLFNLSERGHLSLRYGIPSNNVDFSNFRIGFTYLIGIGNPILDDRVGQPEWQQAYQEIMRFDNGILLIRLPTRSTTIKALDSLNQSIKAREIEEEVKKIQEETIAAFEHLNFCAVQFFYDYNSSYVFNKELDNILLDNELNPISVNISDSTNIYIAEFGAYQGGEIIYHAKHDIHYLKEHNISPDSSAAYIVYKDQGFGVGGLVVMDSRFNQIPEPFPSFIKMYNSTLFRDNRTKSEAVKILNKKLTELYKEATITTLYQFDHK